MKGFGCPGDWLLRYIMYVCARSPVCARVYLNRYGVGPLLISFQTFISTFLHVQKKLFSMFPEIITASIRWSDKSTQGNSLNSIISDSLLVGCDDIIN